MSAQKIRNTFLLFCSLITLAFAGAVIFNYAQLEKQQEALAAKQAEIERLTRRVNEQQTYIEKFNAEKKDFEQYLFKEKDVPAFLEGISAFAQQTGINVLDMKAERFREVALTKKPATTAPAKKVKTAKTDPGEEITLAAMPIAFNVEGTFPSLVRFLNRLESFKQLLSISDIRIQKKNNYPTLQCNFKLKIYSFKTISEL